MNKELPIEVQDIMTEEERAELTPDELAYLDSMSAYMKQAAGEYVKQQIRQTEYAKVKTGNRRRNKAQRKARRQNRK